MAKFERTLQNDIREFTNLNPAVAGFLEEQSVSAGVAYAAHLAIEEMVLNVIKHAYDSDVKASIDVALAVEDGTVVVNIRDSGRAFDPREVPKPEFADSLDERMVGGLGIHLVRSMTESIDYRREGDNNRVEIRITPSSVKG